MKEFSVSADLDISAQTFLLERDSVAFRCLLAKLLQALDLGSLEFEKEENEAGSVRVWQKTYPSFDKHVPSAVAKLVKKYTDKLVYTDVLSYDPQKLQKSPFEIEVTSITPVFRDKTMLKSRLIIESLGPKRCRQTLEGSIDVRVSGLGRTAERIIVQQLSKVYKSIPEVILRWIQLRATLVERQGSEWLLLGRPDTRIDWILQEYRKYQKGRLPGEVSNSGNTENLASLGLSEEQVMQKAQSQLQHEQGGLKKLPTGQQLQAGPTPGTPHQAAGPAQLAGLAAAEHQANVTAAGNHATDNQQSDTVPTDRESSSDFVTPDRATTMELARAEEPEPVPVSRRPPAKHAEHSSLDGAPEHQPNDNASSVTPHGAMSYPKLAADGHVGMAGVTDVQLHGRPCKKRRPNMFMQCISCGASSNR